MTVIAMTGNGSLLRQSDKGRRSMDFTGKVALVTGGGNGIGRAASVGFARHGAKVVAVDRDGAAAEATAGIVRQNGGEALAFTADVTKSAEVKAYVKAVFLGLRHVLPEMIRQGGGAVVNTASVAGLVGTPGMPAYVASKHAVLGLTKTAAGEVARQGIRVNAVCPGPVDTRMIHALEEQLAPGNAASVAERYQAAIPSGRYTTAEEIANMVLFLCSDLAANTTGGQFVVDGGRTATPGAVTNLVAR